ncbi:alpha/beta fold hydrolase [Ferruginibacter albus]|uniref:alpha/beta fold hydrolase n=1 Tax=Ferruginibacter albus TaxID=2875540 RepID=UPI001CC370A9|nr:alpha/beta hydrolase [Ferruginibacter albus]UAY52922.1 alpha/beta hydrolase [Ferruginibacter albus]
MFSPLAIRYKIKSISFLFLLFISSPSFSQQINYGNNPSAGNYKLINGIKLYYEIYGKGEPVLLIHGNGGSISSFKNNIPYFATKYKVITVDSRSQGKSLDAGDSISFELMANDFITLLDSLQIDSCNVIGWSDGGITALIMAMRYPSRIKKIAASGANIIPDSTALSAGLYKEMQEEYNRKKNMDLYKSSTEKNEWKLFLLDYFQPHINFSELAAIKCPSLIICGDRDLIRLEHTIKIYQNIPNAWLWIVPNSGHGTLIEHADEFNKKVDEFFSRKW